MIERTLLQERLIGIARRFPQRRIVVLGDAIADQFVYGAITRVSREAPVFILRHECTKTVPGGAANCAMNLAALGASVSLVSFAGTEEAGRAMVEKLNTAGVNCRGIVISEKMRTTTKARILAGQTHSTRQQVIRIDYEDNHVSDPSLREQLRERVLEQISSADALIISDYNYGVADPEMAIIARDAAMARKIPALVDSRFRLGLLPGFTSATPNGDEVEQLLGRPAADIAQLPAAAEDLRQRLGYRALLLTRGSHGMLLLEAGAPTLHIDAVGGREPVDVTGAGDTVVATYTLALASDASFSDAARLANYAGGLVVMKRGTASVTAEELEYSVLHSE
jgi:D-glycero-beta-D-manno-heptose-7-phosphate kinase